MPGPLRGVASEVRTKGQKNACLESDHRRAVNRMQISEARASELKSWITTKLEHISDADSDVLADYALALIRSDVPENELRQSVIENLDDFLKSNTSIFVDELLDAVAPKPKANALHAEAPSFTPSTVPRLPGASFPLIPTGTSEPISVNTRKRAYNGAQGPHQQTYGQIDRSDRPVKHTRRGSTGGRGVGARSPNARIGRNHVSPLDGLLDQPWNPMPLPPPGAPFDPQQAAAALWVLQSMGIPIPNFAPETSHQARKASAKGSLKGGKGARKNFNRCRDYDSKGICHRGASCPYIHDADQIIVPATGEYDPNTPILVDPSIAEDPQHTSGHAATEPRVRGGRGANASRGRGQFHRERQEFLRASHTADGEPNTSIVVDHIPEDYLNEDAVRETFEKFGAIQKISMRPEKSLALVKYEDHAAAKAAYESPKVIFDNRFVKVYWHRSKHHHRGPANAEVGPPNQHGSTSEAEFDPEAFERALAVAQKKLEERKALKAETDIKLAEVQKQREELEMKRQAERQRLEQKIRDAGGSLEADGADDNSLTKSSTDALRAQLKALEDEAASLGLEPEPWASEVQRGHPRGRAYAFGRGYLRSSRGMYRGRGSYRGGFPGGGAYNLDNRPKTVKIEGVVFDEAKDEALRQHLLTVGEYTSIETSESKDSQSVTFKDRATAERFFYGIRDIPGVGKLEFEWVKAQLSTTSQTSLPTDDTTMSGVGHDGDSERGQGRSDDERDTEANELDDERWS